MAVRAGFGASGLEASLSRALLQSRSDAIVATDREGLVIFWNPGAARIFGFSAEDVVGRSLDVIIPETLRDRHWQGYRRAMEDGRSRYGEGEVLSVPALRKDGQRISVEFTIALLREEAGAIFGIAAIMRDATQRFEELKALRRKLAASLDVQGTP